MKRWMTEPVSNEGSVLHIELNAEVRKRNMEKARQKKNNERRNPDEDIDTQTSTTPKH